MKIYQSIFNRGKKGGDTGRIENTWTLRLTHVDERENRISKTWQYATKQDAKDDIDTRKAELIHFVESKGLGLDDVKTFRQWAEYAKKDFYRPAVIREGRKVAGVKSASTHVFINQLVECFGDKPLVKFTKYDLDRYKVWRLEQGDRRGKKGELEAGEREPVRISSINRALVILKHLLNEAHDAGLIAKNITKGSKAIDADAETARIRTLTDVEEVRLLASCSGPRTIEYERKGKPVTADIETFNPHLKAIILLGLDSGLRRGEILTLEWKDIDFDNGIVTLLGMNTKTQRTRLAPLTSRTKAELLALPNFGTSGRIFPFNNFKRSWTTAVKVANIDGLHFHDLRRTCGTRMELLGIPHAIVQKILGHAAKDITGRHYVAAAVETVRMVAGRIDAYNDNGGLSFLSETYEKHSTTTDNAAIIQPATATISPANDARETHWPDVID
ncbi:MAG: site-specific integrase [Chloracidobacterium sp.]|nr:site-specific integrase [Chloracidobacterium sp.]